MFFFSLSLKKFTQSDLGDFAQRLSLTRVSGKGWKCIGVLLGIFIDFCIVLAGPFGLPLGPKTDKQIEKNMS